MMLSSFISLASLSLLAGSALALPRGAPRCAINNTGIAMGHGTNSDSTLGYGVSVRPVGDSWEFQITNSASRMSFQGILMFVNSMSSPRAHLGKFEIDTQNFKFQDKTICDKANVTGAMEATFTHANPSFKPLTTIFKWTPDSVALAATDLTLQVVVATHDDLTDTSSKPRWMSFFYPIMIPNGGSSGKQPGTDSSSSGQITIRKIIKCVPKSMYGKGGYGMAYGHRSSYDMGSYVSSSGSAASSAASSASSGY